MGLWPFFAIFGYFCPFLLYLVGPIGLLSTPSISFWKHRCVNSFWYMLVQFNQTPCGFSLFIFFISLDFSVHFTTIHGSSGRTKFAKFSSWHRVILTKLTFQNIPEEKPCECARRKLNWGPFYIL